MTIILIVTYNIAHGDENSREIIISRHIRLNWRCWRRISRRRKEEEEEEGDRNNIAYGDENSHEIILLRHIRLSWRCWRRSWVKWRQRSSFTLTSASWLRIWKPRKTNFRWWLNSRHFATIGQSALFCLKLPVIFAGIVISYVKWELNGGSENWARFLLFTYG